MAIRHSRYLGPALEWLSLPLLLILWQAAAWLMNDRLVPGPMVVTMRAIDLALTGPLVADFTQTLTRAGLAFVLAMGLGGVIGYSLGRHVLLDRLLGPWVVVGLNLPAIVLGIICYILLGLTEFALVLAVVINKTPLVITTIRQGVRDLSPANDELALACRLGFVRRLRHIHLPQIAPHAMIAARTGLALIWKIVLVFEVLGADGGVGFRIGIHFQTFDMTGILAYTLVFVVLVMTLEHGLLRPMERKVAPWHPDRR